MKKHRLRTGLSVVAVIALYILSIGPAAKLSEMGLFSWEDCVLFYLPLYAVSSCVPGSEKLLTTYVHWWSPNGQRNI